MTVTALPAKLAGEPLSDREAVADICYASFAALDHGDEQLLRSVVTPDIHTFIANKTNNSADELKANVFDHVGTKLDTVHYLTNMRVSVDTPTTARVTFVAQAVHCRSGKGNEPGPNKYTTGAHYLCSAVKADGVWRLKDMESNHVWSEGDRAVMKGA
ncbi:uncharacterized protein GGS25DRAFT_493271 [Hypoxylon fragiforme]|uniref:uncharacterized protein n=1 Tax=Hypoxylon fragiforme TaxID=63214 RepID=UPI0020C5CA7C|nr:uncharacterized protein GGS25DRAFT_493271 [Hypoxylon fragiforme]KAI2606807.1 hypothetical protein GGS25DRAFT_493271 [Hypoxylon fragiforme]